MIEVRVDSGGVSVKGHSGYAPPGKDIVCAAVSALTLNLIKSIECLTKDRISYMVNTGDVSITYGDLSESAKLLIDSFFIGISRIEEQYPDNIRLL